MPSEPPSEYLAGIPSLTGDLPDRLEAEEDSDREPTDEELAATDAEIERLKKEIRDRREDSDLLRAAPLEVEPPSC